MAMSSLWMMASTLSFGPPAPAARSSWSVKGKIFFTREGSWNFSKIKNTQYQKHKTQKDNRQQTKRERQKTKDKAQNAKRSGKRHITQVRKEQKQTQKKQKHAHKKVKTRSRKTKIDQENKPRSRKSKAPTNRWRKNERRVIEKREIFS